mgnify:CR=1 FL=1|jgi:excisionase family DNA binding protein
MTIKTQTRPPARLLRVDDVADRLSVAGVTVRRLISRGDLKAIRVGKAIRVRPEDVESYLQGRLVTVAPEAKEEKRS